MNKINQKNTGERIKSARMQLGYSRREFAEKFNFSSATLQAWEDEKYPVPLKGILKYVNALFEAGLVSSMEWFTQGNGLSPQPKEIFDEDQIAANSNLPIEKQAIYREISYFEKTNKNSIVVGITDDTMLPFFKPGDFVGGNILSKDSAQQCIGSFCIVTIPSGEILVRKLKQGTKKGYFNLVSTNLDSDTDNAIVVNCGIQKVAEIIWHRKGS